MPDPLSRQLSINEMQFGAETSLGTSMGAAYREAQTDSLTLSVYRSMWASDLYGDEYTGIGELTATEEYYGTVPQQEAQALSEAATVTRTNEYGETETTYANYISRIDAERMIEDAGLAGMVPLKGNYINKTALQWVILQRRSEVARQRLVADNADTAIGMTGVMAASFAGAMADPGEAVITLAASYGMASRLGHKFIQSAKVVRATTAGGRVAQRARYGTMDGFASSILPEFAAYSAASQDYRDYTLADSMQGVIFGAVAGGGMAAGLGALSEVLRRGRVTNPDMTVLDAASQTKADGVGVEIASDIDRDTQVAVVNYAIIRDEQGYSQAGTDQLFRQMGYDIDRPVWSWTSQQNYDHLFMQADTIVKNNNEGAAQALGLSMDSMKVLASMTDLADEYKQRMYSLMMENRGYVKRGGSEYLDELKDAATGHQLAYRVGRVHEQLMIGGRRYNDRLEFVSKLDELTAETSGLPQDFLTELKKIKTPAIRQERLRRWELSQRNVDMNNRQQLEEFLGEPVVTLREDLEMSLGPYRGDETTAQRAKRYADYPHIQEMMRSKGYATSKRAQQRLIKQALDDQIVVGADIRARIDSLLSQSSAKLTPRLKAANLVEIDRRWNTAQSFVDGATGERDPSQFAGYDAEKNALIDRMTEIGNREEDQVSTQKIEKDTEDIEPMLADQFDEQYRSQVDEVDERISLMKKALNFVVDCHWGGGSA